MTTHHAAVHAVQHDSGNVTFTVSQGEVSAAAAQAARVLSIDIDASGWDALGRNDPLIGNLQTARPGLRPPLFYSAYEAAAWAVLSGRRPHQQMVALRGRLSADHGAVLDVGGQPLAAFPTPEQRLEITEFPGLPEVKITRPMESPGPR
jgi:DNA-3-methyladenine glycosylase II